MKIKNIDIDQFASIIDFQSDFNDGINMILGENESGKSTVVEFIFQSLFNNEQLKDDKFLATKVDGTKTDYIGGEIEIEKDSAVNKITKLWEKKDFSFTLQSDGIKTKDKNSNIEKLKSLLPYKEGDLPKRKMEG